MARSEDLISGAPLIGGALVGIGLVLTPVAVATVVEVILIWLIAKRVLGVPWPWQ